MNRLERGHCPPYAAKEVGLCLSNVLAELPLDAEEVEKHLLQRIAILPRKELLEEDESRRAEAFQSLVQRFIIDIRYGCESPACTTPHCFGRQKRVVGKPVRRPTFITARMMAYFLASKPDAFGHLCPNHPKIDPRALANELGLAPLGSPKGLCYPISVPQPGMGCKPCDLSKSAPEPAPASIADSFRDHNHPRIEAISDYIQKARKPDKKDRKSLSQNLFDTMAVKCFESTRFGQRSGSPVTRRVMLGTPYGLGLDGAFTANWAKKPDLPPSLSPKPPFSASSSPIMSEETLPDSQRNCALKEPKLLSSKVRVAPEQSENPPAIAKAQRGEVNEAATARQDSQAYLLGESRLATCTQLGAKSGDEATVLGYGDRTEETNGTQSNHLYPSDCLSVTRKGSTGTNIVEASDNGVWEGEKSLHSSFDAQHIHLPPTDACLAPMSIPALSILTQIAACLNSQPRHSRSVPGSHYDGEPERALRMRVTAFVNRSIHFNLSEPDRILESFPELDALCSREGRQHNSSGVTAAIHWLGRFMSEPSESRSPRVVCESLCTSLEAFYALPPELQTLKSPDLDDVHGSPETNTAKQYLPNNKIAKVILVCVVVLLRQRHLTKSLDHSGFSEVRRHGYVRLAQSSKGYRSPDFERWTALADELESEPVLRLTAKLAEAIAARIAFDEISQKVFGVNNTPSANECLDNVLRMIADAFVARISAGVPSETHLWNPLIFLIDRLRTVILRHWNGNATFKRWSAVGGALAIMQRILLMPTSSDVELVDPKEFELFFITDRIDVVQTATEYLQRVSDPNSFHILDMPFLFAPESLVIYFRTMNYASMSNGYQHAGYHNLLVDRLANIADPVRHAYVTNRMEAALNKFLVLEVRRQHLLEDTFNQLWGREKRELLRPLKVRMGMDQGEEGVDHGGVSQEFFRLVFAKAFNPDAQLFAVDPRTRMIWFEPMSREPLATYEMLGLLVSIAIYNGITLPVTFPVVLYQKLLGKEFRPAEICWRQKSVRAWQPMLENGWPDLAAGLTEMAAWNDGDVSTVFIREYAFSVRDLDAVHSVNMMAVRQDDKRSLREIVDDDDEALGPAPLVTNETRDQFIHDYADWLVNRSVAKQFEAFARGFHTCIEPRALSLLSPTLLRDIAEGYSDFSIAELERHTRYEDGYTADHPFVATFWRIVTALDIEKQKALLEFVTASDRVPVVGMQGITFWIVRNGPDSELLPTSMTCFGKLLLPEYASEEKLRSKLEKALENSKGFGSA